MIPEETTEQLTRLKALTVNLVGSKNYSDTVNRNETKIYKNIYIEESLSSCSCSRIYFRLMLHIGLPVVGL